MESLYGWCVGVRGVCVWVLVPVMPVIVVWCPSAHYRRREVMSVARDAAVAAKMFVGGVHTCVCG